MSYLRSIPTRRLLVLCATIVVAGIGATAIALAATGGGATPPPKPLAEAIHDALSAGPVEGVTARIEFTNHLVDAASLQGGDPLLTGATGRLWATGDRLRLELQAAPDGGGGDVQILVDGDRVTVIDAAARTVYRVTLPAQDHAGRDHAAGTPDVPALSRIQDLLARVAQRATLSGAQPSNVAGRPAYTVRISPRHDGGLLGAVEAAWDAARGVPLRAAVYATTGKDPVLELKATDIAFGPVAAADLTVPEPAGAKVVDLSPPAGGGASQDKGARPVTGLDAVRARVRFDVAAPATLVGLPRQEVRLVAVGDTAGVLVSYGRGLGGMVVLEAPAAAAQRGATGSRDGLLSNLPKISVNGASGQELDTALGTVIRFQRGGVAYTLLGSVPPAAAEAAARGL